MKALSKGAVFMFLKPFFQVGMLLLLLPLAYIYLFTSTYDPFHRGFFCDDQDLK